MPRKTKSPAKSKFKWIVIIAILLIAGISVFLWITRPGSFLSRTYQVEKNLIETRSSARDVEIISNLVESRTNAQLLYSENNSYSSVNCGDTQISLLCSDIEKLTGQKPVFYSSQNAYCGYVKLSKGNYYCVDNNNSGKTDVDPNGANYCNGSSYVCPSISPIVSSESSFQNQQKINPTSAPDPTATWKTYKDTYYGFEVKYPGNLTIIPPHSFETVVWFMNGSVKNYDILISDISGGMVVYNGKTTLMSGLNGKDLITLHLTQVCKSRLDLSEVIWKQIIIGGLIGFQANSKNECAKHYLPESIAIKNRYSYSFGVENGSVEEYDQLLSTFKFL